MEQEQQKKNFTKPIVSRSFILRLMDKVDKYGLGNNIFFILLMMPIMIPMAAFGMIVEPFSKTTFWCDFLGWHKAPDEVGFDGCSLNGVCPRCQKNVLQDSNGDWF